MLKQLASCAVASMLMMSGFAMAAENGENAYAEPAPTYLRQFAKDGGKVFVLERYDANGKLAARAVEPFSGDVVIVGAVDREIAGQAIRLRGLTGCPAAKVLYNRVQTWDCVDAARDYAGAVYNQRATVILCKTLQLSSTRTEAIPASCFILVGGRDGEKFKTVNDDDSMVFLGLAEIGKTTDGRSRRPDLETSQSLSQRMGFKHAD